MSDLQLIRLPLSALSVSRYSQKAHTTPTETVFEHKNEQWLSILTATVAETGSYAACMTDLS